MTSRSTGKFISYDIRPAKQSERRILIEILKIAGDCGFPIETYRYVGMGANRFYDFLLIHRYLGLREMVSLEHDPKFVERARFNAPYRFITVEDCSAADFAAKDVSNSPTIYWLDYDGGLGPDIVADIASYGARCKLGDFLFITVFAGPPRLLEGLNDQERLIWLQENLGDAAGNVLEGDAQKANFPRAVHKVVATAFQYAFAARTDGKFCPLMQVEYSDSVSMVSVGGGFLSAGQSSSFQQKITKILPFLPKNRDNLYEIKSLHLTEKERRLLDEVVTGPRKQPSETKKLKKLGFKDSEVKAYQDLIRFLPRYVETIV